jgi:DNA-binding GntR family transcriptional regulator
MEELIDNKDSTGYWKLHGEFHDIIQHVSGNKRLIDQMKQINEYLSDLRTRTLVMDKRRRGAMEEHKKLIKAFEEKDEMLSEKIGREHVINGRNFLLKETKFF